MKRRSAHSAFNLTSTAAVAPSPGPKGLAKSITEAFTSRSLDLSARPSAPPPGWQSLPEVVVANRMKEASATDVDFRLLATFVAAMDRARDADRLWAAGLKLFQSNPWPFRPEAAIVRSFTELSDTLAGAGVSQRHLQDSAAWRRIAESLVDRDAVPSIHRAIYQGEGETRNLLESLQARTPGGTPRFPSCPDRRLVLCGFAS